MSSTTRKRASRGLDFFRTPSWCVEAIAPHLPRVPALDPCCGDGAILDVLERLRWGSAHLNGFEIDNARAVACDSKSYLVLNANALSRSWDGVGRNLVIMNPPFAHAEAFVRKAIAETVHIRGTVAALLRLAFLESKSRTALHREHPSDVFVLSRRPSFTGGSTDSCAYAWFVWGPGRGGRWSVL